MNNVLGIVSEYNPFHNGHNYHLEESKKLSNSDFVICIMSGNFTQRGDSSIINKWSKSEMAILNGADLVIELPVLYSISSAENFAEGAIKILKSLGIVTHVSFGSELGNLQPLDDIANILYKEPKQYKELLINELDKGVSYAKARENAILKYLSNERQYKNILSKPNNILSIEYLKALKKLNSSIQPITIKRQSVDYCDNTIKNEFASATGIRELIKRNNLSDIKKVIPNNCYDILETQIKKGNIVPDISCFEKEILYNLRKMSVKEIANLADVSEGLEFSIKQAADSCNSLKELKNIVKSKRFAETRINRILLYALLNISKSNMKLSRKAYPYIRILAYSKNGKKLLPIINKSCKSPIIISVKKFTDINSSKTLKMMLDKDIFATNIYTLGYESDSWSNLDFTHKIVTK